MHRPTNIEGECGGNVAGRVILGFLAPPQALRFSHDFRVYASAKRRGMKRWLAQDSLSRRVTFLTGTTFLQIKEAFYRKSLSNKPFPLISSHFSGEEN